MQDKIKAGSIVTCPICKDPIYKLTRDLYAVDILDDTLFDPIGNNQIPINGLEVESHCGNEPPIKKLEGIHFYGAHAIHLDGLGWYWFSDKNL